LWWWRHRPISSRLTPTHRGRRRTQPATTQDPQHARTRRADAPDASLTRLFSEGTKRRYGLAQTARPSCGVKPTSIGPGLNPIVLSPLDYVTLKSPSLQPSLLEINHEAPARVVQGLDLNSESVLPVTVALTRIPRLQILQVGHLHHAQLYSQTRQR